jgi:hypothetical protein
MRLLEKRRARKAEEQRVAAIQATCDHDWKRVEKVKGQQYYTFRSALIRDRSSTALKYQCRRCGKVEWESV